MPTPQDPLGLGDLPSQQPAQGGYGTPVRTRPDPREEYRQAYAWTQATRSVPPQAYEDRNQYWEAKRQIERQERLRQQQEEQRRQQLEAEIRARGPAFGEALRERLSPQNIRPIAEWAGAQAEAPIRAKQAALRQLEQGFTARGYDAETAARLAQSQYETMVAERPSLSDAFGNDIPYVSPVARRVRGAVESVVEPVLETAYRLTPAAQAPLTASGESEAENAAQRGATLAGAFVPVTEEDFILEAMPGIGLFPGVASALAKGGPDAARAAAVLARTPEGRLLFEAVDSARLASELGGSPRPYANAPEEVVRAHADQGVRAAKEELARRNGELLFKVREPSIPAAIADDPESVSAYRAIQKARERPLIQHFRGRPIRVADHSGLMPEEFVQQVAKRSYQKQFTDAVAGAVERIDEIGNRFFNARKFLDEEPVKWRSGRFAGITVDPRAMALNEGGLDDAFEQLAKSSEKTALPLAEFSGRLVFFNPYAIFEEMTQLIPRFARTKTPTAQMREALRQAADMAVADIVHEIVHNGVRKGLPSHGEQFVALQTRLHGHARKEIEQLAVRMRRAATKLLDNEEFWNDFNEYQGWAARSRQIRDEVARTGDFASTVPPPGGGDAGIPSSAGEGDGTPGGGVPGGSGMAAGAVPGSPPSPPMGGAPATPGAQPPPDPLEVVLQATTTEDLPKASFMRGVVDSVRGLRRYFGAAARADRATDRSVRIGAQNIIVRYAGQIQQSIPRESGLEVRQLRREAGAMTEKQRRSMYVALDDVDADVRNRALSNLTLEQQIVYGALRMRIDAVAELLVARGIIDPDNRVANYFPHILDFADEGRRAMTGGGLRTPIKKPRNAIITGHRTQQTMAEDILEGHRPLTLDPFKVYEHFLNEAKARLVMADILDDIKTFDTMGVMYVKPGEMPPAGFSIIHHPMFEKTVPIIGSSGDPQIIHVRWAVRDNVAGYIKALVEPSAIRKNKAGRALLTGTSSIKRTVLGGPLDINFLGFMLKTAFYANGTNLRKFLPGALHTALMSQEAYDQFMLQEIGYAGQKMTRLDLYKRLDEAGLTGHGASSEVSRMMGDDPTTTLPGLIPIVGDWYERAQTFIEQRQFDRIIPTLKFEGTAELVESKLRTARGRAMSLEDVEREAANDMNTNMGGLNRIAQGRSKTAQDVAALLAIAPDWLESRLAAGFGAFIPGAKNASNRRIMARWMIFGAISTVIGSWIYGEERGWSDEQKLKYIAQNINPVKMDGKRPKINGHFMEYQMAGSGQWTSLLSFEKDLWRLVFGIGAGLSGDRGGFDLTAGGYLTGRFGVIPRLANDAIFQRNYSGQPITENTGWAGVRDWLAYEATQTFVPSFGSGLLQAQIPDYPGGEQSTAGAIWNMTGLGRARTISATDTVDRAVQDEHIPKYDENGRQIGEYMSYRELPNDIAGEFAKRHPKEVQDVIDAREARGRDTFDDHRAQTLEGLAEWAKLAPTDYKAYREGVSEYAADQGILLQEEIRKLEEDGVEFSEREGDQGLLDGYFDAVAPATNIKSRKTDFNERDRLEEGYRATLTPYQNQRLDEMLGYSADPTYKQLKAEKKQIADAGYFDRYDTAWEKFAKHEEIRATGATTPEEFEAWVKADLVRRGIAPELYTRHEYYGEWQDVLEEETADLLDDLPEIDLLVIKLGYGQRVHSQKAADLYKKRTGLDPPVPGN